MKMKIFCIVSDIALAFGTGILAFVYFNKGNNLTATCWTITSLMWIVTLILEIRAFKKVGSEDNSETDEKT